MNRKELQRRGFLFITFELLGIVCIILSLDFEPPKLYIVAGAIIIILAYWGLRMVYKELDIIERQENDAEER